MTNLPYPVINNANPILKVKVSNVDALPVTVGETALYVARVDGSPAPTEVRYPLSQKKNSVFYFILLNIGAAGRYTARLVYNGVTLGTTQFIYEVPIVEISDV